MKSVKMAKRSFFGSMVRKRFSDITNALPQPKHLKPEVNPVPVSPSTKDYIDELVKENETLLELIEDRNKIITLSGTELQKVRISFQKMQLQNWNLAQSNSQMMAELNMGKEKLKTLQHELVCKDALLRAKRLELKGKENLNIQNTDVEIEVGAVDGSLLKANNDMKHNKRCPTRTRSVDPSTTSCQVVEKEMVDKKSLCLKRQSARFKSQQHQQHEDLFETDYANTPYSANGSPMHKCIRSQSGPVGFEVQDSRRSSMGRRPLRQAAEKVHSYKEIPINVKMRRKD